MQLSRVRLQALDVTYTLLRKSTFLHSKMILSGISSVSQNRRCSCRPCYSSDTRCHVCSLEASCSHVLPHMVGGLGALRLMPVECLTDVHWSIVVPISTCQIYLSYTAQFGALGVFCEAQDAQSGTRTSCLSAVRVCR